MRDILVGITDLDREYVEPSKFSNQPFHHLAE